MPMHTTVLYPASTLSVFSQNHSTSPASPASSTATLLSSSSNSAPAKKDYFVALGVMQSTYGFAGMAAAPTPKTKPSKRSLRAVLGLRSSCQPESNAPIKKSLIKKEKKDYGAAFGKMSASHGFPAGSAAVPQGHWRSGLA
ncbi:hypothetical protein PUNSTDRAFT_47936 [Punctularia strigosozonata HHB-11173 SS5]|uniref:Uncharacterized protein n=1 Tax=Punctularia strigosozonata (strain HHB-11173) TaxID=741275 RepID=R7S067_PUNST|nr:uncharacterized protein PUNSTDRAFT_47936 [Punctularia strigosozonata HHB-11173 SS5]EIN03750.1 hypothetical protein PUNSTDRAFT_47936 [Punctularia strigosozonata HHB-11173 SS5]